MVRPRLRAFFSRPRTRAGRGPTLSCHDVASPRIQPALDGARIAHLSDIHVRTGVIPRALHAAVEVLNELKPDLVVLTGDYVCMSTRPLPALIAALKKLRIQSYATLGNHDHWTDERRVRQALAKADVEVLSNEHRRVRFGRGHFYLVGIDDSITRHHDPERAFTGIPGHATRVVLSHDPRSADFLHHYRPALILSGHTHGGQIYIRKLTPYLWRKAGAKYLSGFFEVHGAVLYVTRGIGASLPVRFRAPREVSHLTLRSAPRVSAPA